MKLTKPINHSLLLLCIFVFVTACSGKGTGGGDRSVGRADVACVRTADDSIKTVPGWVRIHSEDFTNTYHLVTLTRQTLGGSGNPITMDYMVHEAPGVPTALVVLIAGGGLDAGITGTDGFDATFAKGNFLVRSAHLFAAQGYRVLTIDRPSDFGDYPAGNSNYDAYRISMDHAVDLSQIINIENAADNLPVIIAGTSRGSISAVAQHALASALAISAPLTSGAVSPIGTANVLPASVSGPVHISWHISDGCSVTTPANASALVSDFSDATGVSISGGFESAASASPCDADSYHGFPGIESCAVQEETDWMATELASLPDSRPVASAQSDSTDPDTQKIISVFGFATANAMPIGALTYSLSHTSTSLGGTISISGTNVTYDPPPGESNIVDTFVYVVNEAGGGTSHNVIDVTINP
jgi:hypothetical protein